MGSSAQKRACAFVCTNKEIKREFTSAAQKGCHMEKKDATTVLPYVLHHVLDFAFHAQSEVEWSKYRASHTDRTAGKEKKMGRSDVLKGGISGK